jgi:hypothetical protein
MSCCSTRIAHRVDRRTDVDPKLLEAVEALEDATLLNMLMPGPAGDHLDADVPCPSLIRLVMLFSGFQSCGLSVHLDDDPCTVRLSFAIGAA